jgi:hypothetical protein
MLTKTLQVCDRQLLATEISVFTGTTVGTSHLWTKICLKITMRFEDIFFPLLFSQEHDVCYILDSFTFCTQIAGTDIAYNLKITYTALEGPALYGNSAAVTSSVHRATMLVLTVNNKVTVSKSMMPLSTEKSVN